MLISLVLVFSSIAAAEQREPGSVPRVSTQARKLAAMAAWIDEWADAGWPSTPTDREWKYNEFDLSWTAAHSAVLMGRSPAEVDAGRRFLATMPVDWETDPDMRVCEAAASYFQLGALERLAPETRDHLRDIVLARPAPDRRHFTSWQMETSENHTFMGHVWRLAAAMIEEDTGELERISSVIEDFVDDRAVYGWYEHASPCYVEKEVGCLLFLRSHAPSAQLRRKAEALLDILFAEYAVLSLEGIYGGPMARVYGREPDVPEYNHNSKRDRAASGTYAMGTILFGGSERRSYGVLGLPLLVFSDYEPPELVVQIARDRERLGRFEFSARMPGMKVREIKRLDALPQGIDPFMNGRIYAYATPNYILGTSHETPGLYQMLTPESLRVSLILRGDPRKALYPHLERRSTPTLCQHRNVQIVHGGEGHAYFPLQTLTAVKEEGGWILGRDGRTFFGFRVVSGTYAWEGVRSERVYGDYIIHATESPTILEVAEAADYGGDFDAFARDLLNNRVAWDGTVLDYETGAEGLSGPSAEYFRMVVAFGGSPAFRVLTREGEPASPDVAGYPRFDCPYLHSVYGSGRYTIRMGGEELVYEFRRGEAPMVRFRAARDSSRR